MYFSTVQNTKVSSAVSFSANYTSPSIQIDKIITLNVQVNITAGSSPTGTLTLQESCDNVNFVDISGSALAVTTTGTQVFEYQWPSFTYARVTWVRTSGTGTADILVTTKGLF